jgi:hypothetical protein
LPLYFGARSESKINPSTGLVQKLFYPAVDIDTFFGPDREMVNRDTGEVESTGTRITRCDLAANFYTDNFASLTAMIMTRKLGQLLPRAGQYGPTWGYEKGRRQNWFRAKIYDKTCELEGRRTPAAGATTARFECQFGSEFLKRRGLSILKFHAFRAASI